MLTLNTQRKLIFFLLIGFATVAVAATLKGLYVNACPVSISIKVNVFEKTRALVTVTYENVSDGDILVLYDEPNLFVNRGGAEIHYIGRSDKRAAYTLKDYERVKAHNSIRKQVEISEQFDFLPGTHEYAIQTGGGYTDPVSGRDWSAPPAIAHFQLTR